MTILVLLILVVLWIVVLTPGMVGKLREKRSTGSIDSFHHSLHLLERTGPKIVAPAYRLQTARSSTGATPVLRACPRSRACPGGPTWSSCGRSTGTRPPSRTRRWSTSPGPPTTSGYRSAAPTWRALPGPSVPSPRQREARRRRRDILTGLLATIACTGLLGLIHSLRALWIVTLVATVALAGFVALAAYATALASQHQQDLRLRRDLEARTDPRARAAAGYPGAWDDEPVGIGFDAADGSGDWEYESREAAAR